MKTVQYKTNIEHRITLLEESLNEVRTNHLPHLQAGIEKVDNRQWWILGTVIVGFLASIAITLFK